MTPKPPVKSGYIDTDISQIATIRIGMVTTDKSPLAHFVYDTTGKVESHDPMDRVGGPYRVTDFVPSEGDRWFLFSVCDCAFPLTDLVRGSSWEDAYETYVDWAAEKRHLKIEEADIKDYMDGEEFSGGYTSDGVAVDTEAVQGHEGWLHSIDFVPVWPKE